LGFFILREVMNLGLYPAVLGADACGRAVWVFCWRNGIVVYFLLEKWDSSVLFIGEMG
jgi:hypothetical protein